MMLRPIKPKSLAGMLLALAVLVLIAGTVAAQDDIHRQLRPGESVTAPLSPQSFVQTFWFEGEAGQTVTLVASTSDPGLNLGLFFTNEEGVLLFQDIDPLTPQLAGVGDFLLEQSGRYFVTVMRLSGAQGDGSGTFSLLLDLIGGSGPAAATAVQTDEALVPTAEVTEAVVVPTETPSPILTSTPSATPTTPAVVESPTATTVATSTDAPGATLITLDAGIQIGLTWNSDANLDLEVRDPQGNSIFWDNPTVSNATFGGNVNFNCENLVAENPTEQVTWSPGAALVGSYEIIVYYITGCSNNAPVNVTVNPVVNGVALSPVSNTLLPDQVLLSSFVLQPNGESVQGASGLDPGFVLANPGEFLTGQTPFPTEGSITGEIDGEDPFDTYSFTGTTGQIVTLRMEATSGSLDTKLFLLDSTGNTVARNDDILPGENTNSEILGHTLVSAGLYTVVATRYGQELGGTEGAYTLTLTSSAEDVLPPAIAALDLPTGSIEVTLIWNTNADLQLLVRDPSGAAVYDDFPTANSGGILQEDGNVGCEATSTAPVSYIYWPTDRLPPGTFEVEVWYQNDCGDTSPVTFSLAVRVGEQVVLSQTGQPRSGQIYLTNFTIDVNGFASVGAGGFLTDSSALDIGSALLNAIPINYGDTVSGTINQNTKFVLYTFTGAAGDQVRVSMSATAGTLDASLFMLSPDGAQLAQNDDAVPNETTDSLIDSYTLPADGTYSIVATHYGLLYGGTSGTYNLTLVRLN